MQIHKSIQKALEKVEIERKRRLKEGRDVPSSTRLPSIKVLSIKYTTILIPPEKATDLKVNTKRELAYSKTTKNAVDTETSAKYDKVTNATRCIRTATLNTYIYFQVGSPHRRVQKK